jgi:photosystem II stability/assembly factor-like uncharacterized protein
MIPKRFILTNIWIILLAAGGFPLRAQWRALGPFGGSVNVVQIDPNHPDSVLAATANASLFLSKDAGESWTPLPFPGELRATLHAVVIDPLKADTYLVALSSGSPQFAGIFRSRDGGYTWQRVPDMQSRQVWSLAVWRGDPRYIAAGTEDGIFLSADGGDSWQRISPPGDPDLRPVVSLGFDPADRHIIYAGTPHLPWKTEDGGGHWQPVHDGIETDSDVFSIQADWKDPGRILAGACSGVYRSVNGGTLWAKAKNATDRTYVVAQHPTLPGTWFAGSKSGLMKTVNGGAAWTKVASYVAESIVWDRAHPGRVFLATENDGVLRSDDDGRHWREMNRGLCSRHYLPLVEAGGALFSSVLGEKSDRGVWKLPPAATNWVAASGEIRPGNGLPRNTTAGDPAAPVYVADGGRLAASGDGGRTWAFVPAPSPVTAVLAVSGHVFAASAADLYRSGDGGRTWDHVDLPGSSGPVRELIAISASTLAAVAGPRVWISFDGLRWRMAGPIPGDPEVLDLAGNAAGLLLAATTAGLMESHDFGATWEAAQGSFRGNTVDAVVRHPSREDVYYAAVYGLIYESTDGGSSWQPIHSETLGLGPITQLMVVPGEPDRLFAMTDTHGVFELEDPAPGSGSVSSASRAKY